MMQIPFSADMKGTEYKPQQKAERLDFANVIYGWFSEKAKENGYAIARHGTNIRDIDLIAVPWIADPKTPTELVLSLMAAFTLTMGNYSYTDKPHGRISFALFHHDSPNQQIDLSIVPPLKASPHA